jgi:hypothetical protein
MPFNSPFTGSRIASIFGQPKNNSPFTSPQPSFPMTGSKRFMTNTLPTPNPVQSDLEEDPSGSAFQRYFDLLQKGSQNRPKQTAYEDALRSSPNLQDYKPSGWRRLAAIVGGAAGGLHSGPGTGMGVADNILMGPYRNALQDYETRTRAAEGEARLEAAERSEYRDNLKTAATLGQAEGKMFQEGYYKGREQDTNRYKAETDRTQAETQRQNALSEVDRRLAQTRDENERRELERQKVEIQRADSASLGSYRGRMAGAAETSAAAARTRASQPRTGTFDTMDASEQMDAENLALQRLNRRFPDMVKVNQNAYGPSYTVEPAATPFIKGELEKEMEAIRAERTRGKPGFGGFGGVTPPGFPTADQTGSQVNPSSSPFDIGPIQR